MKIRSISLRFFTSFCHTLCNHRIPFKGIAHNRAKITRPHFDCLITRIACCLNDYALKYSTLASYITFYVITKEYNNYKHTLDK